MSDPNPESDPSHNVLIVGAGVVGLAIADAHLICNVPFWIADQDLDRLQSVQSELADRAELTAELDGGLEKRIGMPVLRVGTDADALDEAGSDFLVIESIVEQLAAKQALFERLQTQLGEHAILCSNTSTLRIRDLASAGLKHPEQICGLHFFMPVHQRGAVEVVAGPTTSRKVVDHVVAHAKQIGKQSICCGDSPGFIVNRMLSPYLNQALLLLTSGADELVLEKAARAYGMPLSPLELIDWIGAPTMFHAGRAYWQAFPDRLDPSPMVPGMVKRKRLGRSGGGGLYDYDAYGVRSQNLAPEARELVERYRTDSREYSDRDVLLLLSLPMWLEAHRLLKESVADSMDAVDLAMAGGLGYLGDPSWSGFFQSLGSELINETLDQWHDQFRSMRR